MTDKRAARSSLKRALPRTIAIVGALLALSVLPGAWGIAYGQTAPTEAPGSRPAGGAGSSTSTGVVVAPSQIPAALPATGDLASIPALLAALGVAGTGAGLYLRRRTRRSS